MPLDRHERWFKFKKKKVSLKFEKGGFKLNSNIPIKWMFIFVLETFVYFKAIQKGKHTICNGLQEDLIVIIFVTPSLPKG